MSLLSVAQVVFFLVFGISHFVPFRYSSLITAIAALIVGVLLLVRL